MSDINLFRPKNYPTRRPTDAKQENGAVVNPPRFMQVGGASSASKAHFKNTLNLRKPGGTKSPA